MKKIIIILSTRPEWGGQHQYAITLVESILESDDVEIMAICGNHYWEKWCIQHKIKICDIPGLSLTDKERKYYVKYPLFSRVYTMYMTKFGRRLLKERIDAVICTSQMFIPNLSMKVVVPVHDLMHRYEGRFPEVSAEYEKRELEMMSVAKYGWCILTDSETGKIQFEESYKKYINKKRTHVVSLPFAVPMCVVECEEEPITVPSRYVFYPAQFWQHKNHINLLKAIETLKDDIQDIHLVLVGSEKNNLENVKKYILENNIEDNVTIKGFVSNGNIKYLYKHAVGLIMPSYFGPTNIPPLEAMMLGCPAAVSDKYAMPEQVGDAGILFNPDSPKEIAECIRKLWLDENLRQDMIDKGYKQVKKRTAKSFGRKVHKIIKAIG